ncbi:MAG: single-stranded-DNA-specific exonuclease RecJ [Peptococcales bacterium]
MAKNKIWKIRKSPSNILNKLAHELNISPTLAMLLANRGYSEASKASKFLEPKLTDLSSPFELTNMKEAIEKIRLAIAAKEKIVIYGDYDVDGITSTTLLTEAFRVLGMEIDYYIPDRVEEGYGLNIEALQTLARQGTQLIITVDCGISSKIEVNLGQKLGLDFIITDHHQPPEELPDCLIINPQLEKKSSAWKNLSGVGVAFKLAQGLLSEILGKGAPEDLLQFMDLVALGTIADIVPLVGENRIIVKYGLEQIASGKRTGIKALCESAGLDFRNITSSNVGYMLAPRLNACGRIGDANLGVKLLLTTCENEAHEIAQKLNAENKNRQSIESKIFQEALEMIQRENLSEKKVIVLAGETWHPGVIGIVASRLVDKFYRPIIILTKQDEVYKGSGRSIPGFHLYQALTTCNEFLESFGGHSQAAGISLKEENLHQFVMKINDLAGNILTEEDFVPVVDLDGEINLAEVDFDLFEELTKLEPFGFANPEPVLIYRRSEVKEYKEVGNNGGHLKLKIKAGKSFWDGIGFNMAGLLEVAATQEPLDLAFSLDKNNWNGKTTLQLIVKDMKLSTQSDNPYVEPEFLERLYLDGAKFINNNKYRDVSISEYYPSKNNHYNGFNSFDLKNLIFIDERDCNDKIGYIKKLVTTTEKTLVYVHCRVNAYNLAVDLCRELPQHKEGIAYFHGGLTDQDKIKIADLWSNNQLKALITTSAFTVPQDASFVENLVFSDLCFSINEHNYVTSWALGEKTQGKIHLLYGLKDKENVLQIFAGVSPEREQLVKFYLLLKKLSEKNNPFVFTDDQLAEWSNIYKIYGAKSQVMGIWLDIFKELGFLSYDISENSRSIYVEKNPSKVNLDESPTFLQGKHARNKFLEYEKVVFLKNPVIES